MFICCALWPNVLASGPHGLCASSTIHASVARCRSLCIHCHQQVDGLVGRAELYTNSILYAEK